jgi:hypothetical protein
MPARLRKFIGLFAILGFLTAYVVAVITVGGHIPQTWPWELAFYGVAGIAWGFPLFPLISWMNRGP